MATELQFGAKRRLEQSVLDLFVAETCALGGASYAEGVSHKPSDLIPLRPTLAGLARVIQRCEGCDLYRHATKL